MKNQDISCDTRLIIDLLDYAVAVKSEALILLLDFYKAFDTIQHTPTFLLQSLKAFGFGSNLVDIVIVLYKDVNSSVMINFDTS